MPVSQECNVCCEKYNKTIRKQITCPYCEYHACVKCQKKYALKSIIDIHCMSCKKEWTYKNCCDVFTKSFMDKEYKTHKQNVLFEEEKMLIQETMPYIEILNFGKKLNENIEKINVENKKLNTFRVSARADRFPKRALLYYRLKDSDAYTSVVMTESTSATNLPSGTKEFTADVEAMNEDAVLDYYLLVENAGTVAFSPLNYSVKSYKVKLSDLNK